ncbi:MAG: DNA polymerase III subunit delta [Bacteroidaceae bacterium]|nr:DNA polymerase III subunit delta [Bacteroidaceae bacterium]
MPKKTANTLTYEDIVRDARAKKFAPVYLLMGEESYYIDMISNYIAEQALQPEERDFNEDIIYATPDTEAKNIINAAKRYPMMSERRLIVVREAQNISKSEFDKLQAYAAKPLLSTVLVICYKHGTVDRRKGTVAAINKNGVVYESAKFYDRELPPFINRYLQRKGFTMEEKAVVMMADYVGTDLSHLVGELDKLIVSVGEGRKQLNAADVEAVIGVSKDYNNFELITALATKDVMKANQIVNYFNKNSKTNPPFKTLPFVFNFFANLMLYHYAPDKSEQGLLQQLGLKSAWQLKEYNLAARNYSARKTMNIIAKIRETDAKIKGVESGSTDPGDIMRELVFFILH